MTTLSVSNTSNIGNQLMSLTDIKLPTRESEILNNEPLEPIKASEPLSSTSSAIELYAEPLYCVVGLPVGLVKIRISFVTYFSPSITLY